MLCEFVVPMFLVGNVVKHCYRSDKMNQTATTIKTHAYNYTLLCVYEKKNNTTHKSHTIPYQPITPQSTGIKIYTQTKRCSYMFQCKNIKIICTMWVHELTMRRIINFSFLFFCFCFFSRSFLLMCWIQS